MEPEIANNPYQDFLKKQTEANQKPGQVNLGEVMNEFNQIKEKYRKNPTPSLLFLLQTKQKRLAKSGIRIGI